MISKETAISMVQTYLDTENQKTNFGWVKYYHNPIKKFLANLLYPKSDFVSNYTFFLDRWIKPDEEKWEEVQLDERMKLMVDANNISDLDEIWWVPYGAKAMVMDYDERYRLTGVGPVIVDKQSGNMYLTGSVPPQSYIEDFKLFKKGDKTKHNWHKLIINLQSFE